MRVAVLFHRFGPYHVARLNAASRLMPGVVGVEASAETMVYAWDPVTEGVEFERVTLSKSGDFRTLSHRAQREHVDATFEEIEPDVVAIPGWSTAEALTALSWCQREGVPVVIMSESTAQDFQRFRWLEWVKSFVVGQASAAFVGGTPHHQYMTRLGMPSERIVTGYDAVDNGHFVRGARLARSKETVFRRELGLVRPFFLASGRFVPKKNLLRLIEAYAEYRHRAGEKAWDLVLLGDGPLRQDIERLRQETGLEKVVHLPGFKQYDELPVYYGLAEAFVHASTTEQWGLVVNEAMAAGLPVIVSERVGCAVDLVRHGENGFIFDPYNAHALGHRLFKIAHGGVDRGMMASTSRSIIREWGLPRFAQALQLVSELVLEDAPKPALTNRVAIRTVSLMRRLTSGVREKI